MKHKMSSILVILLFMGPILIIASSGNVQAFISGDYTYTLDPTYAHITDYSGTQTDLVIPSTLDGHTVIGIGDYAFEGGGSTTMHTLVIPDTIQTIGTKAFWQNFGLTSITLGNGLTSVGFAAFSNSNSLVSVNFGTSLTTLPDDMFANSIGLVNLTLPNNIHSLGSEAFSGCTALTNITAWGLTDMGQATFSGCTALTRVWVISSITTIGMYCFWDCPYLTDISFAGMVAPISVGTDWITGTSASIRGHAVSGSDFPPPGSYFHGLLMAGYFTPPSTAPHIISSPITTISYNVEYVYFPMADQPGTNWTLKSNATWLSITNYPAVVGISVTPDNYNETLMFWVSVTFTNANGSANQNYTLNVTGIPGNNAADAWLTMTPAQSLLAVLIAGGVIFILITYLTLRRRN